MNRPADDFIDESESRLLNLARLDLPDHWADNSGNIWSFLTGRFVRLRPTSDEDGYLRVFIYSNGSRQRRAVHRLVLLAFVGPCPPGLEACHKDGNPANNALTNLRWDTHQNNINDRSRLGRTARGERVGGAKLTPERVLDIREKLASGEWSLAALGRLHGVSPDTIRKIARGLIWRHVT